ncbi:MAG: hypothetical protein K6F46_05425 [Desulfovibrio sp.]|nr:hypothetical protein [Desulfovibrio sp.]
MSKEMIEELLTDFPLNRPIVGEQEQKLFLCLFGAILRIRNILSSFDDFKGKEILSEADFQDYQSRYIDLKPERKEGQKEDVTDDIVFETELVRQVEINIDYILMLVETYRETHCKDKEIFYDAFKESGFATAKDVEGKLVQIDANGVDALFVSQAGLEVADFAFRLFGFVRVVGADEKRGLIAETFAFYEAFAGNHAEHVLETVGKRRCLKEAAHAASFCIGAFMGK